MRGIVPFLQSTDAAGFERATLLFLIRTGVLSFDWLVVNGRTDVISAAGVQGAGYVSPFPSPALVAYHFSYSVYGWMPPDAHNQHTTGK